MHIVIVGLSRRKIFSICLSSFKICTDIRIDFTSTINQQMHLYNFHLKHFKTLKTTPTCFDLFKSSSGSFVVPC